MYWINFGNFRRAIGISFGVFAGVLLSTGDAVAKCEPICWETKVVQGTDTGRFKDKKKCLADKERRKDLARRSWHTRCAGLCSNAQCKGPVKDEDECPDLTVQELQSANKPAAGHDCMKNTSGNWVSFAWTTGKDEFRCICRQP